MTSSSLQHKILLIDPDESTFEWIRGLLQQVEGQRYELKWLTLFSDGLKCIRQNECDVFFLSDALLGSEEIDQFRQLLGEGVSAPLVLLSDVDGIDLDPRLRDLPVSDVLNRGRLDFSTLLRAIRYVVEQRRRERIETSLQDSEALYHSLVQSLPVCVLRKNLDGAFIFANQAYCDFTNRLPVEILGKTDFDLSPPEIASKFREDDRIVASTGQQLRNVEVNQTDGRAFWVEVIKTPVHDARGRIVGTQAIFWDVTERQMAVVQLQKSKEAAEAANRSKSEFLANMSHEIRTPLNAVIGMTELVLESKLTQSQREFLEMVLSSGESLLAVINDILDFSKIEAGKLDLLNRDFELSEVVGDTVKSLALRARRQSLEIAFHVAQDVPSIVVGDSNRLRQILINLLGNSIKFTDTGEIVLHVRLDSLVDEVATIHFEIVDTGIGIPDEKLASIFEAFEQADSGSTRRFGGTGLGLSISRRLVALMGGHIWVESLVGFGSRFHFTAKFPVVSHQSTRIPPDTAVRVYGKRVLVVDDNRTNRRIYQEMLQNWGMVPILAEGGHEALGLLMASLKTDETYDLMLTDGEMPTMDGISLVREIHANPNLAGLKILFLTSADRPVSLATCEELNVSAYLIKPVKQSELFDAIAEAFGVTAPEIDSEKDEDSELEIPPLKILLAEDNKINQKLAIGLLQKWGHTVTLAENGLEAIKAWEHSVFDLIIMDIQMPEMDGLQTTRAIRSLEEMRNEHIPIIAMTAHAMIGDREQCLDAGMDGYVAKPLRMIELRTAIAQFFGRPASPAEKRESATQEKAENPLKLATASPDGTHVQDDKNGIHTDPLPVSDEHSQIEEGGVKIPRQVSRKLEQILSDIAWRNALKVCGEDHQLLQLVMRTFVEEMPQLIHKLNDSIRELDRVLICRMAHTIKGGLRPFGTTAAGVLANQIEIQSATASVQELSQIYESLLQHLTGIIDEVQHMVDSGEITHGGI